MQINDILQKTQKIDLVARPGWWWWGGAVSGVEVTAAAAATATASTVALRELT